MAAIFGEGKIFGKLHRLHSLDTLWVKNSVEIALSLTVSEILANYSKVVLKIHNEVPDKATASRRKLAQLGHKIFIFVCFN